MLRWIILFPLMGFLVNGLWYGFFQTGAKQKPANANVTGLLASGAMLGSFGVALTAFMQLLGADPSARVIEDLLFNWITIGNFKLDFALRLDALNGLFALVITGVGTLIHIYSMGYMADDETPGKYFAYLNLFCFAMLILVLGSSLPVMFLGWEGVGLCSYLLIGYWYTDPEKAAAGKKAFVVNRVGDLGFLLGMFMIYQAYGTLDFAQLKTAVVGAAPVLTWITLLLFVGCTGKSAQIPLYVWLPDAMAGPTPVSALIHAATMVTSGVYLIARLSFMYALAPETLHIVAWVGAITAFFAATMAIVQTDIKKVLAYSTVSQLGYMFLGCGVGAYDAGVFHVITHAFFKALLFLGAGSVIYGMHHEQNILHMGGLKSKMPVTYKVFAIGWLAICGVAPLSGFFSKDEILWKAWSSPHGSTLLWAVGAATALMTAFYMTRLFSLTFLGAHRGAPAAHGAHADGHGHGHDHGSHDVHESPAVMTVPLIILAVLSIAGGWIGIPHMSWLEHWLHPVVGVPSHEAVASGAIEWVLMALSLALAAAGIFFGLRQYRDLQTSTRMKSQYPGAHKLLFNKWYVDEAYEAVLVRPVVRMSKALWVVIDTAVIDRLVLGFGRASLWMGSTLRVTQTGSLQNYAWVILAGLLISIWGLFYGIH